MSGSHRYLSFQPGVHHSTNPVSSRLSFGGRPRRRGWEVARSGSAGGHGVGLPGCLPHLLGLPQLILGGLAAEDGLVALSRRRQAQEALGFQILPGRRQLLLDLHLRGLDSLNRLLSGKALVTQLCLEIVDSVPRFGQQPFRFVACSDLRLEGLPGGVQLIDAAAID
jgi:hypothetical protein